MNVSTAVTVTASKDLSGVPAEYKAKYYTLNLRYVADTDLTPMAEGGYMSFIPDGDTGVFYEVHKFVESGSLSFINATTQSITADCLIVAGGGGAGGIVIVRFPHPENETPSEAP
jgi:hypothetical protein